MDYQNWYSAFFWWSILKCTTSSSQHNLTGYTQWCRETCYIFEYQWCHHDHQYWIDIFQSFLMKLEIPASWHWTEVSSHLWIFTFQHQIFIFSCLVPNISHRSPYWSIINTYRKTYRSFSVWFLIFSLENKEVEGNPIHL